MDEASAWIHKAAIAELMMRHIALNDAAEWEALAGLHTQDARMNRPTAPEVFIEGRTAILEAFKARPPRVTRHVIANVLVTLEGKASASASRDGPPVQAAAPPLLGTYHDKLVDMRDGWRFCERRDRFDFAARQ